MAKQQRGRKWLYRWEVALKLGREEGKTCGYIVRFVHVETCRCSLLIFSAVLYFRLNTSHFYSFSCHWRIGFFLVRKKAALDNCKNISPGYRLWRELLGSETCTTSTLGDDAGCFQSGCTGSPCYQYCCSAALLAIRIVRPLFLFYITGHYTWGLVCGRQALYYWTTS